MAVGELSGHAPVLRSTRVALLLMACPPYPGRGAPAPDPSPMARPADAPPRHIRRGGFGTLGDTFVEAELAPAAAEA